MVVVGTTLSFLFLVGWVVPSAVHLVRRGPLVVLLRPVVERWLAWSMRVEMQTITDALTPSASTPSRPTLHPSTSSW